MGQRNKNNNKKPSIDEYFDSRAAFVRDSAANAVLMQNMPYVPKLPAYDTGWNGLISKIEGKLGVSDATRIKWHGYEPYPETCLYNATSQYGDRDAKAVNNQIFKDDPQRYGFISIPMSEATIGDLLQFSKEKTPKHSAIYTGETAEEGIPLVSYSRGGVDETTLTEEGRLPTMVHNNFIQNVASKIGPATAFRYVGTPSKKKEWTNEYYEKYSKPTTVYPNLPMTDYKDREYKFPMAFSEGGFLQPRDAWDRLSMYEKAEMMKVAVKNGIYNLNDIRQKYNEFAEGGSKEEEEEVNTNSYSVSNLVNAFYQNNPREEYLGEPEHQYDFTQSEEWANTHGYYPDARGHRDDRVKKPAHPSHPSRGIWDGDRFILTDVGMQNPNYTLFGLNDGGQDPQAILTYNNSVVLPEVTVTPKGNFFYNPYDNIELHYAKGGKIHIKPSHRGRLTELKARTGKTEAELYRTGSPATRKMITFARNARKWKHDEGGPLFDMAINSYAPGGDIVYGHPYYSYDENGQLVRDENGKPILNYNATLPEIEVIGTNRNYPLKAKQERAKHREMAKAYFSSTPTPSNIYKGIEALVNSSPLVTTAATVNPNIVYGIAPADVAFAGNPLNSTTSNLLKWIGKPLDQKPNISALVYLNSKNNPEYARMAKMLQDNGVDLSKLSVSDMTTIFNKRQAELLKNAPERFTMVRPIGEKDFSMADFVKGRERPVGETQLVITEDGTAKMEDIVNYTRNLEDAVHGVQERGLNSAIYTSNSIGGDGVITGEIYLSAPKQYHVAQKFKDRRVVGNTGQHSNFNMVRDRVKKEGSYDTGMEYPASSMLELARAGDDQRKILMNAPFWKLGTPTYHVPTKSTLFDPRNIDNEGNMIIDWDNPFIFLNGGLLKNSNYE